MCPSITFVKTMCLCIKFSKDVTMHQITSIDTPMMIFEIPSPKLIYRKVVPMNFDENEELLFCYQLYLKDTEYRTLSYVTMERSPCN